MKKDTPPQEFISWSPETIVNLISELAWPIVILFIAWYFKGSIQTGIGKFFNRNNLTELSVGAGGITAKIVSKQETELIKNETLTEPLPEGMDAESIRERHIEQATSYSLELLKAVENHTSKLDVENEEKIEILCSEVSLLQAYGKYMDITLVLFQTQYKLFNEYFYPNIIISKDDIVNYFEQVKGSMPDYYIDWDAEKYLTYPLAIDLIELCDGGYKLTKLGSSYVIYIRNNPGYLSYLSNM